jgi:hypothetical protein
MAAIEKREERTRDIDEMRRDDEVARGRRVVQMDVNVWVSLFV